MSTTRNRTRRAIGIAGLVVALALIGGGGWLFLSDSAPAVTIGGPFTLEDPQGRTVTDTDLRGSWLLVYFGYTYCPDVCPTTLTEISAAMDKLGPRADKLRPVFITVDPRRDTPDVMKAYVAGFHPRLLGLTGTAGQIATVASEYKVYYAEHRTGPGPNDYSMDHSSLLYLMDPNGDFVAPIRADGSADTIAAAVAQHIS
jgi:protein SCO1/2